MSGSERKRLLDWLRVGPQGEEDVRALTNARVLTEGIDVPVEIYTHVSKESLTKIENPLDRLMEEEGI